MNRRKFLGTLVGGLAGAAAVRTWPFRVYSFPSLVMEPTYEEIARYGHDLMVQAHRDMQHSLERVHFYRGNWVGDPQIRAFIST
jgi:hypothetical protein